LGAEMHGRTIVLPISHTPGQSKRRRAAAAHRGCPDVTVSVPCRCSMSRDTRKPRDDKDGVRVFEVSGGRRHQIIAVLVAVTLVASAGVYLLPGRHDAADVSTPLVAQPVVREPVASRPARPLRKPPAGHIDAVVKPPRRAPVSNREANRMPAKPDSDRAPDPALNAAATEDERSQLESWAHDLVEGLRASGETGGIAVFPPPGTNPVRTGIVVPEKFELPEGYVRYYQVTDDGRRLEPILMFSPDYEFVGDNGQPITLPKDGIVPPDMAPPGLPVRMLEIPQAPDAPGAGSH
jgi:hypothetical protein